MVLHRLELTHFRCVGHADIEFAAGRNLITGPNGSGKTSILEAIFLLGSGHSFKSPSLQALIEHSFSEFMLVGKFSSSLPRFRSIGVRCAAGEREIRVDGEATKSVAELAKCFPVQVIDPEVHQLLEDGPRRRRMFMDWGVFHVEQSFHDSWRRFNRALKQRNAQLKSGSADFGIWDIELAVHGDAITEFRQKYIDTLALFVKESGQKLLGQEVALEYLQGWRRNITFSEALIEGRLRDQQRATTTVGPHRADLVLKVGGHIAKDRISRGEQKMLACSLILAQQLHRASLSPHSACLLLDDPAAELDVDNLEKLLELIGELPVQLIATSLSPSSLSLFKNAKKFHVEHGSIEAVA